MFLKWLCAAALLNDLNFYHVRILKVNLLIYIINKVNLKSLGLWLCGFKSRPGYQGTKIPNNQSNK
nr:MAG TPA_asm: hypothetical protein [Caudoviricetes sp.]